MTTPRLSPEPILTAVEVLAADRLLDELLLELAGDTVIGLDRFRAEGDASGGGAHQVVPQRATA